MNRFPLLIAFLAVAFFAISSAAADNERVGTFTVQVENDKFTGTDRHYTNGIRLVWASPRLRKLFPRTAQLLEWLYPFDPGADARVSLGIGQSMFTPNDIAATELIPGDRPYAGWLYLALALNVEAERSFFGKELGTLDTMELNVGMIGPASLAEQTQKFVHKLIDTQRPNGWDNQLRNEPGVALVLERKWRRPLGGPKDWETDVLPSVGVSLGNVDTSLNLGAVLRVGQGLKVDYGPPLIRPNLTGVAFFDRAAGGLAWYLFGGASARAVVHNIFLDGNTFVHSHSVDKNYLVGDLQAGAVIVFGNTRMAFTYAIRTKEFDGQDKPDRFGSISVSMAF